MPVKLFIKSKAGHGESNVDVRNKHNCHFTNHWDTTIGDQSRTTVVPYMGVDSLNAICGNDTKESHLHKTQSTIVPVRDCLYESANLKKF